MLKNRWIGLGLFLLTIGCSKDAPLQDDSIIPFNGFNLNTPKHFDALNIPANNPLTLAKVNLGKKLFFDPILSLDSTISCGSCHKPELAFADSVAFSVGVHQAIGKRNSPSLINIGYANSLFWDGGVPSLEKQVLAPIENPVEMNLSITQAVSRLKQNPYYVKQFKQVFNSEPSTTGLFHALAAYERSLIAGNSRYDKWLNEQDDNILTLEEIRGKDLFFSKRLNCKACHGGVLFSTFEFKNNGLQDATDEGRYRITYNPNDLGKFKVPSLRNVALTAPYMHNGSLKTLEDVVNFYSQNNTKHLNTSLEITTFTLSPQEKKYLIAFLKTLTDTKTNY